MENVLPPSTHSSLRARWIRARRASSTWLLDAAWPGLLVLLVALALRLTLILLYPLLYDGDAYGRWSSRDHPFNTPWVPLFQVSIYLLTRVFDSILAVRLLSACFGATASLSFWLLLRRAFGSSTAYLGALLLALNPLFVTFSVVPYQESLFLTLALLALWLALGPDPIRWPWLVLVVALAELTRYEGWLLALLIWALLLWRRRQGGALSWRFVAGSALALAWAPLLWIAVNRNVSPTGIQTLDPTLNLASLPTTLGAEWPDWQLNLGLPGGILALGGLLWLGWQSRRGNALVWMLLAFLLGDLLLLAFLRPFSPGNLRLPLLSLPVIIAGVAGLLIAGTRLLYGVGGQGLRLRPRALRAGAFGLATAVLVLWYLPLATQRVAGYDDLVRPAYTAAQRLDTLSRNATVAVIGSNLDFAAAVFYAQQDGWDGLAIQDTAPVSPASLSSALRAGHVRLLLVFGSIVPSASITTLVQQGFLVPAALGSGYGLWTVHLSPTAAPASRPSSVRAWSPG